MQSADKSAAGHQCHINMASTSNDQSAIISGNMALVTFNPRQCVPQVAITDGYLLPDVVYITKLC
jgi:hypothetical protein